MSEGFTLIELLVVIAIIGILAGLVSVNLNSGRARARDGERRNDLKSIQTALELSREIRGRVPGIAGTHLESSQAGCDWIPNLAPQYLACVPTDPSARRAGYVYHYGVGDGPQAGAYYLEARLEQAEPATLANDPGSNLTLSTTFTTGTFIRDGVAYIRISSGPTTP
ncbi:prepilin-type N-terminal cleavage/methylation domain-containing protein [Candidatus Berkelbacteria bacterium]|nr:prepilin-type N-terminal cleavage/methylation domain-containing protein [Candidatus Berkelbacteria bacterium]